MTTEKKEKEKEKDNRLSVEWESRLAKGGWSLIHLVIYILLMFRENTDLNLAAASINPGFINHLKPSSSSSFKKHSLKDSEDDTSSNNTDSNSDDIDNLLLVPLNHQKPSQQEEDQQQVEEKKIVNIENYGLVDEEEEYIDNEDTPILLVPPFQSPTTLDELSKKRRNINSSSNNDNSNMVEKQSNSSSCVPPILVKSSSQPHISIGTIVQKLRSNTPPTYEYSIPTDIPTTTPSVKELGKVYESHTENHLKQQKTLNKNYNTITSPGSTRHRKPIPSPPSSSRSSGEISPNIYSPSSNSPSSSLSSSSSDIINTAFNNNCNIVSSPSSTSPSSSSSNLGEKLSTSSSTTEISIDDKNNQLQMEENNSINNNNTFVKSTTPPSRNFQSHRLAGDWRDKQLFTQGNLDKAGTRKKLIGARETPTPPTTSPTLSGESLSSSIQNINLNNHHQQQQQQSNINNNHQEEAGDQDDIDYLQRKFIKRKANVNSTIRQSKLTTQDVEWIVKKFYDEEIMNNNQNDNILKNSDSSLIESSTTTTTSTITNSISSSSLTGAPKEYESVNPTINNNSIINNQESSLSTSLGLTKSKSSNNVSNTIKSTNTTKGKSMALEDIEEIEPYSFPSYRFLEEVGKKNNISAETSRKPGIKTPLFMSVPTVAMPTQFHQIAPERSSNTISISVEENSHLDNPLLYNQQIINKVSHDKELSYLFFPVLKSSTKISQTTNNHHIIKTHSRIGGSSGSNNIGSGGINNNHHGNQHLKGSPMITGSSAGTIPSTSSSCDSFSLSMSPSPSSTSVSTQDELEQLIDEEFKNRDDIIFNTGQSSKRCKVKCGTVDSLIDVLTHHRITDPDLVDTFLLTYKTFTTAQTFLAKIIERYEYDPITTYNQVGAEPVSPELLEQSIRNNRTVKLRVVSILKLWADKYFDDFERNPELLKNFMAFIEGTLCEDGMEKVSINIQRLVERKKSKDKDKTFVPYKCPPPILPTILKSDQILTLQNFDDLEIARQLTLIEHESYSQIKPNECINLAFSKAGKEENSANIVNIIKRSNIIPLWVATEIVQEERLTKRANIIKKFISIADHCRNLNNFNAVMEILSGLNLTPVFRLKKTWETLPRKYLATFRHLNSLMAPKSNFKVYRDVLHTKNPPCLPFLGVYLTDLTFIEEGTPDTLENGLINVVKRVQIASVIKEILQFQQLQYAFTPVPVIRDYLLQVNGLQERALYKQSRLIEPS
eukprot:gene1190-1503_t